MRVLREDMLTCFSNYAELKTLECSIVLHGVQAMNDETKYRAAAILEILTGQRVASRSCDVLQEDPMFRSASDAAKRELEQNKVAYFQQALAMKTAGGGKNAKKASSSQARAAMAATAQEMKKVGNGINLLTSLSHVKMLLFLEKLREFYLPDIVGGPGGNADRGERAHLWKTPMMGHGNNYDRKGIALHFEKAGGSKRECYPRRYPVGKDADIQEAITCYVLKSPDLLKFPDIELHFEALAGGLGGARAGGGGKAANNNSTVVSSASSNPSVLNLILRPTVKTSSILGKLAWAGHNPSPYDNLKLMNYLLSQYFNSYMTRPHVGLRSANEES